MLDGAQAVAFVAAADLDRAHAFSAGVLGLALVERYRLRKTSTTPAAPRSA